MAPAGDLSSGASPGTERNGFLHLLERTESWGSGSSGRQIFIGRNGM